MRTATRHLGGLEAGHRNSAFQKEVRPTNAAGERTNATVVERQFGPPRLEGSWPWSAAQNGGGLRLPGARRPITDSRSMAEARTGASLVPRARN